MHLTTLAVADQATSSAHLGAVVQVLPVLALALLVQVQDTYPSNAHWKHWLPSGVAGA